MREVVLIKDLDPTTADYLQCLFYEVLSYKSIMDDILLNKRGYKHNKETCEYFLEKYNDAYTKFELMKQEVMLEYAGRDYVNEKYIYDINFLDRQLVIYKAIEECYSCH